MKKLTFKVNSEKEYSVISLIKEINNISCRIYLDLENGYVVVENVNDDMIETVIELVNNNYTILAVDIDNIETEPEKEQEIPADFEKQGDISKEGEEPLIEKQPQLLEPQSEDDLIIKKVEFQNEYIETVINKLLKTVYWAMYQKSVPEKEIASFIYSAMSETSMRYSYKKQIQFSIGDIVECDYGMHLPGEVNGPHVLAIVCDIYENMVYVIPITKVTGKAVISRSYIELNSPEDVIYNDDQYTGGTAIIEKSKYIRQERINSVIGRTMPEFFKKLLYQLASTFDFTHHLEKAVEDNLEEVVVNEEAPIPDIVVEESNMIAEEFPIIEKAGKEEIALFEMFGASIEKIDASRQISDQVVDFFNDIGMSRSKLITQSFIVACHIKERINYENIILQLRNLNPNIKEEIIKASLKEDFKNWLKQYPELAQKCPKISLMSLLKVFAKKFKEAKC